MSEKQFPLHYIANEKTIYVWVDAAHGKISGTFLADDDEDCFATLTKALKKKNHKAIIDIVSLKFNLIDAINSFGGGQVGFEDGDLFYVNDNGDKTSVDTKLTAKIKSLIKAGKPADVLVKFLDNLLQNPDPRAIKDLYDFLIVNDFALTEDGCFLAYKIVGGDFKDLYTGTMDNSPGSVVSMNRNDVNPDPSHTCSHGLHICAKDYLPQYGGFYGSDSTSKVVVVKQNPMHVVAFPLDYRNAKARVCEYEVLGTLETHDRDYMREQIAKLESGVTIDTEGLKAIIKSALAEQA